MEMGVPFRSRSTSPVFWTTAALALVASRRSVPTLRQCRATGREPRLHRASGRAREPSTTSAPQVTATHAAARLSWACVRAQVKRSRSCAANRISVGPTARCSLHGGSPLRRRALPCGSSGSDGRAETTGPLTDRHHRRTAHWADREDRTEVGPENGPSGRQPTGRTGRPAEPAPPEQRSAVAGGGGGDLQRVMTTAMATSAVTRVPTSSDLANARCSTKPAPCRATRISREAVHTSTALARSAGRTLQTSVYGVGTLGSHGVSMQCTYGAPTRRSATRRLSADYDGTSVEALARLSSERASAQGEVDRPATSLTSTARVDLDRLRRRPELSIAERVAFDRGASGGGLAAGYAAFRLRARCVTAAWCDGRSHAGVANLHRLVC